MSKQMKVAASRKRSAMVQRKIIRAVWGGAMLLGAATWPASAAPTGTQVVHGTAHVTTNGNTTVIRASNNAVINFTTFDILASQRVQFILPSASSRVLEQITGGAPTQIDGTLSSNGHLYIANPSGITFGATSHVNAAGLSAIAGTISSSDFLGRSDHFSPTGAVTADGSIQASSVMLVGQQVTNHGSIVTPDGGSVALIASGGDVFITQPMGRVMVQLPAPASASSTPGGVDHSGKIAAPKGQVLLGAGDMYSLATHSGSRIQAKQITLSGGKGSTIIVSGTLDASDKSATGKGGTIEVLGDTVNTVSAVLDASGTRGGGTVLVGGDAHGGNGVPTASITTFDEASIIHADAITAGNGGRVVIWADKFCFFAGTITARGGATSGNGGSAETSGHVALSVDDKALVNLLAPHGHRGTWLMDPAGPVLIDSESGTGTIDTIDDFSGTDHHTVTSPIDHTTQFDFFASDNGGDPPSTVGEGSTMSCSTASFIHTQSIVSGMMLSMPVIAADDIVQYGGVSLPTTGSGAMPTLTYQGFTQPNLGHVMFLAPTNILNGSNTVVGQTSGGSLNGRMTLVVKANNVQVDAPINTFGGSFMINSAGSPGAGTFTSSMPITTGGGAIQIMHSGAVSLGNTLDAGGGNVSIQSMASSVTSTGAINGQSVDLRASSNITLHAVTSTGPQTYTAFGFSADGNLLGQGITVHAPASLIGAGAQMIDAGSGSLTLMNSLTKTTAGGVTLAGTAGISLPATGMQSLDGGTGSLTALNALTKTNGDLMLLGAAGISVTSASVPQGQLTVMHNITASGDLSGANGVALMQSGTLMGSTTQTINGQTGSVVVAGALTKTMPGDLMLAGSGGINVATVQNQQGMLIAMNNLTATGDFKGTGVMLMQPAAFTGSSAQVVDAGANSLTAMSTVTKMNGGDLMMNGDSGVIANAMVNVTGGGLTAQTKGGRIIANGAATDGPLQFNTATGVDTGSDVASFGSVHLAGTYFGGGIKFSNPVLVKSAPVPAALIFTSLGDSLTLDTQGGDFTMTKGEKLGINGSLIIRTHGGNAILGDITATGNLIVDTVNDNFAKAGGNVTFLNRPGGEDILTTRHKPVRDKGLGFLAGGRIDFLLGGGKTNVVDPIFRADDPADSEVPAGFAVSQYHGTPLNTGLMPVSGRIGDVVFSGVESIPPVTVPAAGTTTATDAATVANSNPQDIASQASSTAAAAITAEAAATKSSDVGPPLGVYFLPPSPVRTEIMSSGATFYDDTPRSFVTQDYFFVTATRLPPERTAAARATYASIFGAPAEASANAAKIQAVMQKAYDSYTKTHPNGGESFGVYLRHTPAEAQAAKYADELAKLADQVRDMGLSQGEVMSALRNIFRPVTPKGVVPAQFPAMLQP